MADHLQGGIDMSRVSQRARTRAEKSSILIEAEGRILKLEVDPAAGGQAATARFTVFVAESQIALDEPEMRELLAHLRRAG
jgi:hypothetical protein